MQKTLFVVLAALLAVAIWPQNRSLAQDSYNKSLLTTDQAKADQLARKISSVEVLGPLAPVALSPFFGLTCLSGTSILCSKGILPEKVRHS